MASSTPASGQDRTNLSGKSSYLKEFSKSKAGVIGLALLLFLLVLSVYVVLAYPSNIASTWNNPESWQGNPAKAPPSWVTLLGADAPPSLVFKGGQWANATIGSGSYNYSQSYTFKWTSKVTPSDVVFSPQFSGSPLEAVMTWSKPDGQSIVIYIASPQTNNNYDVTDQDISQWIHQFVEAQTGTLQGTVTFGEELDALFDADGPNLLSNPVLQGTYHVRIDVLSGSPATLSPASSLTVDGRSYGIMGTDLYGRPIQLGILLGLPYALELGAVTSVSAVVFGVVFGGISGYIGGRRDGFMQWFTLVFLALPALPFLVAISYSFTLSLISEALLIAALSWPFYAIIARSVALSVKSQAYVEADRAMGISAFRTFFTHFMPRLTPVTIAYTVLGIPAGILLAQTLAFLGIAPPNIVTWGGILDEAFVQEAALFGWWWWVFFPGMMIVVVATPFVLVGFALDRIVSPKVSAK
jgi:peptide/nickel transport system permease protein